ncbi:autotransporter outer membrane beta-barrel domain-containing protein, partial [Salmonella enterica subsp. enterica serovar Kentucky]|nr:autotransporter outer membrane beta-barrel domain-containing protein [Salmonella enterica subsp. enterica serovar Kentucky]
ASRIVAGAYDYNVVQKGKNWYLTSYIEPDEPIIPDPVDPVIPHKLKRSVRFWKKQFRQRWS